MASITELADGLGLRTVAIISKTRLESELVREASRLEAWQERGFAAEMGFMKRPPELFGELSNFLPGVKSVVVVGVPYLFGDSEPTELPRLHGRVARYAWGGDYHEVLKSRLLELANRLQSELKRGFNFRVFSDAVPLLERAIGRVGGLGFVGKNTLLITPGLGSYYFLGELLLDIELDEVVASYRGGDCSTCSRCLSNCPTDAFESPFVLNATRCISYLTIEKRSEFSIWEESAIREWLFGCDICQEVCPFNNDGIERATVSEFKPRVGPTIELREVLRIRSNIEYRARFKGSAILRAKREQLLRNAATICGNLGYVELATELLAVFDEDSAELARNAAKKALIRLYPGLDAPIQRKLNEKWTTN